MPSFFPSLREDGAQLKDIQAPFSEIYELWGRFSQAVMRGPGPLSVAERELIAAYTSGVNACTYCYHDHTMAAEHFGIEPAVFETLMVDVELAPVDGKMKPLLRYVGKLTASPSKLTQADADAVFDAGWSESELHFAILVSARFNCINRLVQGHGIEHSAAIGDSWKSEQGLTYNILEQNDV